MSSFSNIKKIFIGSAIASHALIMQGCTKTSSFTSITITSPSEDITIWPNDSTSYYFQAEVEGSSNGAVLEWYNGETEITSCEKTFDFIDIQDAEDTSAEKTSGCEVDFAINTEDSEQEVSIAAVSEDGEDDDSVNITVLHVANSIENLSLEISPDDTLSCTSTFREDFIPLRVEYTLKLDDTEIATQEFQEDFTNFSIDSNEHEQHFEDATTAHCSVIVAPLYGDEYTFETAIDLPEIEPEILPPTEPTIELSWTSEGEDPHDNDDINCAASGSTDPQDLDITYSYSWVSDTGSTVSGDVLSADETEIGNIWTCDVTVSNGFAAATYSSEALTIIEAPAEPEGWGECPQSQTKNDAQFIINGEASGQQVGRVISSAGDVDGDGLDDFLVGAPSNSDVALNAGKIYLILGSSVGADAQISLANADYSFLGENMVDQAGGWLSAAGDVDNDGLDDFLISTTGHNGGTGKVYVILGSSLGSETSTSLSQASFSFTGENTSDNAGWRTSSAGDVDGDGKDDILISSNTHNGYTGKVYLMLGSSLSANSEIPLSGADYSFTGEATNDQFGVSLAKVSDIDGDGKDEFLVGSHGHNSSTGKAYLFLGNSLGSTSNLSFADADYSFTGENAGDQFSFTIAGSGDVDGDGKGDFLMSAPYYSSGTGKTYLFLGASLGSTSTLSAADADYTFVGEAVSNQSGSTLTFAGDVDGDGKDDILISAPYNGEANSGAGKNYLILASSLGSQSEINLADADHFFFGEGVYDLFGRSVASAGDINGDGLDEFMIGSDMGTGHIGLYMTCEE